MSTGITTATWCEAARRPAAIAATGPVLNGDRVVGGVLISTPLSDVLSDMRTRSLAAVAGCPVLVAVGAPSSLAVDLAADRGVTLCGFVRGGYVNVYTEPWRIQA